MSSNSLFTTTSTSGGDGSFDAPVQVDSRRSASPTPGPDGMHVGEALRPGGEAVSSTMSEWLDLSLRADNPRSSKSDVWFRISLKRLIEADDLVELSSGRDSLLGLEYVSMFVEARKETERPMSGMLGPAPSGLCAPGCIESPSSGAA